LAVLGKLGVELPAFLLASQLVDMVELIIEALEVKFLLLNPLEKHLLGDVLVVVLEVARRRQGLGAVVAQLLVS